MFLALRLVASAEERLKLYGADCRPRYIADVLAIAGAALSRYRSVWFLLMLAVAGNSLPTPPPASVLPAPPHVGRLCTVGVGGLGTADSVVDVGICSVGTVDGQTSMVWRGQFCGYCDYFGSIWLD